MPLVGSRVHLLADYGPLRAGSNPFVKPQLAVAMVRIGVAYVLDGDKQDGLSVETLSRMVDSGELRPTGPLDWIDLAEAL